MENVIISSIPQVSAGGCVNLLYKMYKNAIDKDMISNIPSVFLWGAMGLGKSQSVKELARQIENGTGKKTYVTDVRLLLFNPIDLRGIPTANEDKTEAVWLRPQIFKMDPSKDVVNILFLDELSAAPQSVQAAAYQIALDKTVGEHKLPDNCIVIAAGNRTTDKSVSYAMPKALANRLLHLEVVSNTDSWNSWAVKHGIHPYVIGFMKFKPDMLMGFDPKVSDLAFATPRSWEMVSNILNTVSDNIDDVFDLIAGLVGKGVAYEFRTYARIYKDLPSISDIFDGKVREVPKRGDLCYALISAILNYAREHTDDLPRIINSIEYAQRLTPDFSSILLKDYQYISEEFRMKLLKTPEYIRWASKQGRLLDEFN